MEHVEVIKDQFTDYAGKVHYFMIAGVSIEYEEIVSVYDCYDGSEADINKGLHIGISICSPEDTFDEKIGALKAIGRAKKSVAALYATNPGYINSKMVKALLEQEAEYLKQNPELYIKGYADSKERYLRNKEMNEIKDNFTEIEKTIVNEVQKDSKFLDNVNKYLDWIKRQK